MTDPEVQKAMELLKKEGYDVTDPKKNSKKGTKAKEAMSQRKVKVLPNEDEIRKMCSKARESKREHFMYLCLAVGTGMRPFELLKVTPMMLDYSYKQGIFIEGKQGKERVVPLHDALYSELKAYISEMKIRKTEKLFSFQDRTIRRFVKRYAIEVGVSEHLQRDIKPYTYRHYFNTMMRKNKIDDQIRKMIVGHNLDYSEGYVHIEWEEQLKAVNTVFRGIPL